MPNWCANHLTLAHDDPQMIERAVAAFTAERFLNEFIPIPDSEKDENWYAWCCDNWGTKWDVGRKDGGITEVDENTVTLDFDSAWSPPLTAYETLTNLGFTVNATYYEPGMAFCGEYTSDDGDSCYQIPQTADEVIDTIPAHLDEEWGISEYMRDCEAEQEYEDDEENFEQEDELDDDFDEQKP